MKRTLFAALLGLAVGCTGASGADLKHTVLAVAQVLCALRPALQTPADAGPPELDAAAAP